MLTRLLIRNIALIDELVLEFEDGLNVFSGETGAGKSILVDSINFLLGGRAERDLLRTGADRAYVEGVFVVDGNDALLQFLDEMAMEPDQGELILARELLPSGKSVCRVNGMATSLATLKQAAAMLVDLHGQHDHQSLLNEQRQMDFLDGTGNEEHQALRGEVRDAYYALKEHQKEFDALYSLQLQREDRRLILESRVLELTKLKPEPGEEEALRRRLAQLRNADRILRNLRSAYEAMYDSKKDEQSAANQLRQASQAVNAIREYDERWEALVQRIDSLYYEAEDIGMELRDALGMVSSDEGSLQEAEARIDLLKRAGKKYGTSSDDLAALLASSNEELAQLDEVESLVDGAQRRLKDAEKAYWQVAERLTESRERLAFALSKNLEQELESLNMKGTKMRVELTKHQEPGRDGADSVRLMLAANRGEEAKALNRIASGGELSRIMLALKAISAAHNVVPTMIFDEIDTGISGRTAQVVSERLWEIARWRQVFCVTHLQQLAAMASKQYLVYKEEVEGRTYTRVRRLSQAERVEEVSRMISGHGGATSSSFAHAENMLAEGAALRASRAVHPPV